MACLPKKPASFNLAIAVFATVVCPVFGETPEEDDSLEILPQPVGSEHFEALMNRSPFLRTLDLAETFVLRGLANIGADPVATLYNRETKETIRVTGRDEANKFGMKLVSVIPANDLVGVSVMVSVGGEEVELKYEANRIAPSPKPRQQYTVKYDDKGRPIPPEQLIKKYHSMNSDQRRAYYRWREEYYRKHPGLSESEKRFPIVDKAIDAIKSGKEPPKP
jgi:hypothetical protein